MGKIAGIPHLRAVEDFEKAGFSVARQGKHVVMTDGIRILTIPRHDPVDAYTMAGSDRDAGLTERQFRKLLSSEPDIRQLPLARYGIIARAKTGNCPLGPRRPIAVRPLGARLEMGLCPTPN